MLPKIIISAIGTLQMLKTSANQPNWSMMTAKIRSASQTSLTGSRTRLFMKHFMTIYDDVYPVNWLPRFSSKNQEMLAEQGVDDLRGVPDDLLNEKQAMIKEYTLANKVYFDAVGAAQDLAPYGFPAYFLDFETAQLAVPIWKGTRPYQQITFQFSLHILDEAGQLSHTDFLDLSGKDPSELLAKALIKACGNIGPVFAYSAGFESSRIRELAERFPELAKPLLAINERMVDLLPIARNRYYHPSQQGSWSIKVVLPAIAPDLSYDKLEGIKDGGMAMDAFCEAIQPITGKERKSEIEKQLLTYCNLDTFAMVRLWQFFRDVAGSILSDCCHSATRVK